MSLKKLLILPFMLIPTLASCGGYFEVSEIKVFNSKEIKAFYPNEIIITNSEDKKITLYENILFNGSDTIIQKYNYDNSDNIEIIKYKNNDILFFYGDFKNIKNNSNFELKEKDFDKDVNLYRYWYETSAFDFFVYTKTEDNFNDIYINLKSSIMASGTINPLGILNNLNFSKPFHVSNNINDYFNYIENKYIYKDYSFEYKK